MYHTPVFKKKSEGGNLIINGTFDTDLSNWTYDSLYYRWSAGKLEKYNDGESKHCSQSITTEIGEYYKIAFDCTYKTFSPGISFDGENMLSAHAYSWGGTVTLGGSDVLVYSVGAAWVIFQATATSHTVGCSGFQALFKIDNFTALAVAI